MGINRGINIQYGILFYFFYIRDGIYGCMSAADCTGCLPLAFRYGSLLICYAFNGFFTARTVRETGRMDGSG
jgi:hypothetical protein